MRRGRRRWACETMPHIGQPGFGAKDISKIVGHRGGRAAGAGAVVVVVFRVVNGVCLCLLHGTFLTPTQSSRAGTPPMSSRPTTTTISSAFESFRGHLDEHHDRRERLIKVHHPATLTSSTWTCFFPVGSNR